MQNKESIQLLVNQLQLAPKDTKNEQEQFELLVAHIEHLINNDFNKLISILYRMDVSEDKLKKAIANVPTDQSSADIIAKLMIERENQKIILRAKYSK